MRFYPYATVVVSILLVIAGRMDVAVAPQSARGPVRPAYEVDPLLVLACGPNRFGPKQKRGSKGCDPFNPNRS